MGFAPQQTPPTQVSVWVHALPSLHVAPSAFVGFEHWPVAGWQGPASWHWSWALHAAVLPGQVPPWQVSLCVQLSPSLQGAVFATWLQVPAPSQTSSVHGLVSAGVQAAPGASYWQ